MGAAHSTARSAVLIPISQGTEVTIVLRRTAYCVEDTIWEPVQSRHAMRGDDLKPRITWE